MTIASATPSATGTDRPQHRYPPAASPSSSQSTHSNAFDTSTGPSTLSYIIHTETNGISDLRLQVSHKAIPSSSKHPLRPAYFRERVLTDQNEITTAISLRTAKREEYDPLASPLTFSLQTKLHRQALGRIRTRIGSASTKGEADDASRSESTITDGGKSNGHHIVGARDDVGEAKQDVAVAATGRENRKSGTSGHARRRSGATGSGTHSALDSRHPSKRTSSAVASSPMIPETEDEALSPTPAHTNPGLSQLAIPSSLIASTSSSPHSAGADRPYSPIEPPTSSFPTTSGPQACTFLLTDGIPPGTSSLDPTAAPKQSWARWATSLLPSEIRPSLSLDTDKSFSLCWLDPPTSGRGAEGVEIAKFEDQSGRWLWNSQTRGKLTLQTSAMQALGLEKEFWITAVLAYIQVLEDKDAYDAARDA
ncbi:hypothetical protein NDA11_002771 [Ustilago hordei]|uniref:Uncharacterized protein n=1 Tax=Ustilago hordei TaxID=120017 RepID=I2G3Q8_USTHO|nr:hypothetical protein NDA10_002490 [Ustilago hordei]KAJ1583439.1 hypothetical protein NDA15_003573 [Ustilago hordei]KAJ1584573.1 hypothetical protein NDA11_002771 [Ustilago hordei]KAJ1592107.1 hypothetical protein NDA12_005651 [Ustilago hordei]KAJ1602809.1 hypothetical protein NDA14_001140 [Ustilago hordei]